MNYRSRPIAAAMIALLISAGVVACGGTGGGSLPVTGAGLGNAIASPDRAASHRKVKAKIRITIPKRKHRVLIHGHYVSPATQSITIAVTPTGGSAENFNADLTPASNPNCTASLISPMVCTISISLAAGSYTASFATYDGLLSGGNAPSNPPTGNQLSANQNVPFTFAAGTANTVNVTLDGIPKTVQLISADGKLIGSTFSGFTASTALSTASVQVLGLDADGNYIIGTGAPTPNLVSSNASVIAVATPSAASPNIFTLTAAAVPAPNSTVGLTASVVPISGSGGTTVTSTSNVNFQTVVNGNFATGTLAGWTPCSFTRNGYAAPINAQPEPMATASQNPSPWPSVAPATVAGLVSVTTPPPNYNPTISATAPPLGAYVAQLGTQNSETKGEVGICQQIYVPASTPYLSFNAYEAGDEYKFSFADQEADILNAAGTTSQQTLFAELSCFVYTPNIGTVADPTSGCEPSPNTTPTGYPGFGGTSTFLDWQGAYWLQRGPYDLTAYEGQTVTLFLGSFETGNDTAPNKFFNLMWVGNVQLSATNSFPGNFNGDARRAGHRVAGK